MRHRFACGLAVLTALIAFAATRPTRAQDPPAGQAPATPPAPSQPGALSTTAAAPDIPAQPSTSTSHGKHTVTVTFDYDFGKTPACSAKVTKHCVQQFIAYDISAGIKNATMMFPIPLPLHPVGAIHGITATSPLLDFESGKHLVSVSAMSPDGTHSRRSLCTTWITIP
jgi:hypothetical protein